VCLQILFAFAHRDNVFEAIDYSRVLTNILQKLCALGVVLFLINGIQIHHAILKDSRTCFHEKHNT
jgi:preprotein translocase subunit SecG